MIRTPLRIISLFILLMLPSLATAQAQAAISWTDVTNEASYKVERNADGGTFAQVGTTSANVVSFNDSPLNLGVFYCWQIIASNAFGDATPSAMACGSANVPGQVLGVQILLSPTP